MTRDALRELYQEVHNFPALLVYHDSYLNDSYLPLVPGTNVVITSYWPGQEDEDVLICVFKGKQIHEPFHRQDFFFINYAYKDSYQALSEKYNNLITINEDECYIGQPYSGYALRADSSEDVVIIGVLIRKDSFFQEYPPTVYTDEKYFPGNRGNLCTAWLQQS